ncbi:MAG: VTT domain-containing protein, partial [bacterium]
PWLVTIAGTIGCCIAGLFDYWLLIPLLNHRAVRSKFENARLFQKALAFFHKFPFRMLVIASCTPLPFYPFKFLSLADGYPLWKYQLALVVGRVPRFYMLAVLGFMLQPPTWLLVVLAFAGVIVCVLKKLFNP